MIACFDDPGLEAAPEVAKGPVIGICQAALQLVMPRAARLSVITTPPCSVPVTGDLVAAYGAGNHCRKLRAVKWISLRLEGLRPL